MAGGWGGGSGKHATRGHTNNSSYIRAPIWMNLNVMSLAPAADSLSLSLSLCFFLSLCLSVCLNNLHQQLEPTVPRGLTISNL